MFCGFVIKLINLEHDPALAAAIAESVQSAMVAIGKLYTVSQPDLSRILTTADTLQGLCLLYHFLRLHRHFPQNLARVFLPSNHRSTLAKDCRLLCRYDHDSLRPWIRLHLFVPLWSERQSATHQLGRRKMHSGSDTTGHDICLWKPGYIDRFHLRLSSNLHLMELKHAAGNETYCRISALHGLRQLYLCSYPRRHSLQSDIRYGILQASSADWSLEHYRAGSCDCSHITSSMQTTVEKSV